MLTYNGPASNDKAVCSTFTTDSSGTYRCSGSFGFFNETTNAASTGENYVSSSVRNNSGTARLTVNGVSVRFYTDYRITYTKNTSSTVYYTQTYQGSTSNSSTYYYASGYVTTASAWNPTASSTAASTSQPASSRKTAT